MPRSAVLNARELADYLGISLDSVQDRARRGVIPTLRTGGRERRFLLADVLAAMGAGAVAPPKRQTPTPIRPSAPSTPDEIRARLRAIVQSCETSGSSQARTTKTTRRAI